MLVYSRAQRHWQVQLLWRYLIVCYVVDCFDTNFQCCTAIRFVLLNQRFSNLPQNERQALLHVRFRTPPTFCLTVWIFRKVQVQTFCRPLWRLYSITRAVVCRSVFCVHLGHVNFVWTRWIQKKLCCDVQSAWKRTSFSWIGNTFLRCCVFIPHF